MAEQEKQYRAVIGRVQFEPREGEAGGKAVRNIVVREVGFAKQSVRVSATLWPSHSHIKIAEGDLVFMEGTYSQNTVDTDDGPRTYHNLSVNSILNLGACDSGKRAEVTNAVVDDADDDDIPF